MGAAVPRTPRAGKGTGGPPGHSSGPPGGTPRTIFRGSIRRAGVTRYRMRFNSAWQSAILAAASLA